MKLILQSSAEKKKVIGCGKNNSHPTVNNYCCAALEKWNIMGVNTCSRLMDSHKCEKLKKNLGKCQGGNGPSVQNDGRPVLQKQQLKAGKGEKKPGNAGGVRHTNMSSWWLQEICHCVTQQQAEGLRKKN